MMNLSYCIRALTILFVGILALVAPRPAFAHATLIRSDPADGALLDSAPGQVQLWFSEEINPRFSMVRLLDATGQPLAIATGGAPAAERTSLRLAPPDLAPGAYIALWKVLSEVDGHWSQGVVIFGVGAEMNLDVGSGAATEGLPWPEIGLRWLNFTLLAGLVGSLAMSWLVLAPLSARSGAGPDAVAWQRAQRRVLQVAAGSAAAGLVVGIGLLAWQVALMRQMAPPGASIWEAGRLVLGQTRWGALWLVRQGLLIGVCGILYWQNRRRLEDVSDRWRWWLAPSVLALLTVQALTGHAAGVENNPQLAIVVAVLHLLAACLWVGGLAALLVVLLVLWQQNRASLLRLAGEAGRAFSPLAALSVGVLIATGLYSMGRQVASPDALITTLYGRALAGKVGLVLLAGAFGLGNALLLHPGLAQPLARRLGRAPGWTPALAPVAGHRGPGRPRRAAGDGSDHGHAAPTRRRVHRGG